MEDGTVGPTNDWIGAGGWFRAKPKNPLGRGYGDWETPVNSAQFEVQAGDSSSQNEL